MAPTAETPAPLLRAETDPASRRLPVSTASKTKNGVLKLTFSKPEGSEDVVCQRITVTVPVGTECADLASSGEPIDHNYEDQSRADWRIVPQLALTSVTFTCTPEVPGNQITFDAQRRFTLILSAIPVSRTPGYAPIVASARTAFADGDDWDDRPIYVDPVEKVMETPDSFFFRSFSCEKPQVENGDKTILRWEGSEAETEYYLWDGRSDTPTKVTGRSCETHALTDTTTFVLEARTKDADNQPVSHYLSTTITVKLPDIRAKTLTATDKVTVTDTFRADNTDNQKTWAGATTFEGDVTITGNNKLTVGGEIEAHSGVTIPPHKPLKVDTIRVPDSAGSRKQVVFFSPVWLDNPGDDLTVKGAVNVDGKLAANGGVTIPSHKPLEVDTIRVPNSAGNRKQVVFNSPIWIDEQSLPAGTPAHLTVKGSVDVSRTLGVNGKATLGEVQVNGAARRGTQAMIAAGDSVSLESLYFTGKFLNGSGKQSHTDNSNVTGPAAFYRSYDGASKFKIAHR
ncbi:hypothetical protein [Streptomyces sp. NPDC001657]|uniref:hypothetical protein n=1 Tax=Streptomyces sp. NPDC001657 TaxID=3154522 RepID=UPI003320EEB8